MMNKILIGFLAVSATGVVAVDEDQAALDTLAKLASLGLTPEDVLKAQTRVRRQDTGPSITTEDGSVVFSVENGKHIGFKFPDGEMVAIDELPEQLTDYAEGRIEATTAAMALGYKVGAGASQDSSTIETTLNFVKSTIDKVAADAGAFIGKQDEINKQQESFTEQLTTDFAAESIKLTAAVDAAVEDMTTKAAETKVTLTESVTAVETALNVKITKLENAAKCNFGGMPNNAGVCVCDDGYTGDTCAQAIPPSCAGATSTGKKTGKNGLTAFCYKGGWDMVMNLASTKAPALVWADSYWTETNVIFGKGDMTEDTKTHHFNTNSAYSKILIVAHKSGGSITGTAEYVVNDNAKGKTFSQLFKGGYNVQITGNRVANTGNVNDALTTNCCGRGQRGDLFIDHNQPLMVNKNGGWSAAKNYNRLATTYSPGGYPHSYAGVGGWHEQGHGSWNTYYESAPISSYCGITRSYGNDANFLSRERGSNQNSCKAGNFKYIHNDYAIFVKK